MVAGFVGALDWGVDVTEVPLVLDGPTKLGYENTSVQLWLSAPWNGMRFHLVSEGALSASTTDFHQPYQNLTSALLLDLTELSLSGTTVYNAGRGGVFDWSVGRRMVTDATGGWILNSRWDGASASFQDHSAKAAVAVGYSGLLLNANSRIAGSPADLADQSDPSLLLGPRRLFGRTTLEMDELFWRQDWQMEALADWDFRSADQALHGAYLTLATSGPVPGGLRERVYTTGAVWKSASSVTSGVLVGAELTTMFAFLGSRLVVSGVGAKEMGGHGFQAISGDNLADVISLPVTHGASVKLDYSIRPLAPLTVGVRANSLWRTSDAVWLGAETGLYGSWNPTSELSFGWVGGIFLPQAGAFAPGTPPTESAAMMVTMRL